MESIAPAATTTARALVVDSTPLVRPAYSDGVHAVSGRGPVQLGDVGPGDEAEQGRSEQWCDDAVVAAELGAAAGDHPRPALRHREHADAMTPLRSPFDEGPPVVTHPVAERRDVLGDTGDRIAGGDRRARARPARSTAGGRHTRWATGTRPAGHRPRSPRARTCAPRRSSAVRESSEGQARRPVEALVRGRSHPVGGVLRRTHAAPEGVARRLEQEALRGPKARVEQHHRHPPGRRSRWAATAPQGPLPTTTTGSSSTARGPFPQRRVGDRGIASLRERVPRR